MGKSRETGKEVRGRDHAELFFKKTTYTFLLYLEIIPVYINSISKSLVQLSQHTEHMQHAMDHMANISSSPSSKNPFFHFRSFRLVLQYKLN